VDLFGLQIKWDLAFILDNLIVILETNHFRGGFSDKIRCLNCWKKGTIWMLYDQRHAEYSRNKSTSKWPMLSQRGTYVASETIARFSRPNVKSRQKYRDSLLVLKLQNTCENLGSLLFAASSF
jgi:hypothetical protein